MCVCSDCGDYFDRELLRLPGQFYVAGVFIPLLPMRRVELRCMRLLRLRRLLVRSVLSDMRAVANIGGGMGPGS